MPDGVVGTDTQPFGLTESAARRIAVLLKDEEMAGRQVHARRRRGRRLLRVFSTNSASTPRNKTMIWCSSEQDGVEVVVDEVSLELVSGGRLDYVEELIGSYFQVVNPNASSSCGCGTVVLALIRLPEFLRDTRRGAEPENRGPNESRGPGTSIRSRPAYPTSWNGSAPFSPTW